MFINRTVKAVIATLTIIGGVSATAPLSATAATTACGSQCGSVFSRELGSYSQAGPVEDVLGGVAKVGQPVILKRASNSDPSEDIIPHRGLVSAFIRLAWCPPTSTTTTATCSQCSRNTRRTEWALASAWA
jgi:hypothetical protein